MGVGSLGIESLEMGTEEGGASEKHEKASGEAADDGNERRGFFKILKYTVKPPKMMTPGK